MQKYQLGIPALILAVLAFWQAWRMSREHRYQASLMLIIAGALVLRCFVASDLYLHEWDERYHALVAKNLIKHPLKPTLYDMPVLEYDYKSWVGNHVWLHKQPLPLWAMGLSLYVFGIGEWALRFPSVLLSVLAVLLTFKIGQKLYSDKVGLLAAFLHAIHGLTIELTGGRVATDHVDVFFAFFIELGVYLSILYNRRRSFALSLLIGFSVGLAVLCKWLPALTVWLFWAVYNFRGWKSRDYYLHALVIGTATLITFLPWQVYIHSRFPAEALWEQKFNLMHLTEVIEGRTGPWYYFLDKIRIQYGELIYLPLGWFIYKMIKRMPRKIDLTGTALLSFIFIPFIFFSFSTTKMQAYLLFTSPAIFVITALFFFYLKSIKLRRKIDFLRVIAMIGLIVLPVRYSIERVKPFSTKPVEPEWKKGIIKTGNSHRGDQLVLFNAERPIETMFYTDFIAYRKKGDRQDYQKVKEQGFEYVVQNEK